jgi:Predicted dehydrogenases and related proteins
MYRVGILGTENSHAMAFTEIINDNAEGKYSDFKVTALYGLEKTPSEAIKAKYPDITIVENIADMVDIVDCAMITARHGKYHKPFAMPFIEAGKPVFVDKPFTISIAEGYDLIDAAKKYKVPIMGGSGCKYCDELLEYKAEILSGKIGNVQSAVMSFAADMKSEYGGFYFYGAHLVEMAMTVFGCDVKGISAFVKNGHLSTILRYDALDLLLSFAKSYTAVAYGEKGYIFKNITTNNIYNYEIDHFTEMVRTGKSSMSEDQLIKPIIVLNAIEESLKYHTSIDFI